MTRYWLSFCDGGKPKGSQFLGACIVRAPTGIAAIQEAWRLGCNPGGEVAMFEIGEEKKIADKWMGRLLTRAECEEFDAEQGAVEV